MARAAACAGLALRLTAAPAAASDAEAPVVSAIRWRGVSAVSRDALEERMLTTERSWRPWVESRPFDEATLREDLDRIAAYYRDRGYYETEIEYALVRREDGGSVRVEMRVEEGEPVRLRERQIEVGESPDLTSEQRAELVRDLPLEPGSVFDVADYRAARDALLRRLADLGHPAARLEGGAEVRAWAREARVRWTAHPGPRVRFGPVSVRGLERVDEALVRRELQLAEGEVFSHRALDASQKAIYDVGLFRSVILRARDPAANAGAEPPPGELAGAAVWPVEVEVEERPPRSVRVGVGYGTEEGPRAQLSWLHRNLFGQARSLDLRAKYSFLLAGVEAKFAQPRFLEPKLRLESRLSFARETVPSFDALRVAAGARLGRPLVGLFRGRIGHRVEFVDVTDAEDPEDEGRILLSAFELGVHRSSVDDALEPSRGTWLDVSLESSLRALGSDEDFLKARAEARWFLPIRAVVLGLRVRGGLIAPLGATDTDDVPVFERFYAGGSTSVRGFGYQRLGPLDAEGDPLGGSTLLEASAELRFPIWRRLGGVVFLDAGQVARKPAHLDGEDFRFSTGPGLRLATPLGSIRVDFGYVLNPPDDVGRSQIHFSVGHTF